MSHLFNDSKTFVDLPLLASPRDTVNQFQDLVSKEGPDLSPKQLRDFVSTYFGPDPNAGLETWTPPDWAESTLEHV